jgi:hypothetical protein
MSFGFKIPVIIVNCERDCELDKPFSVPYMLTLQ